MNQQNQQNAKPQLNRASKYKGVSFDGINKKWKARITIDRKKISLGYFNTEIKAARVYDLKALELFGEFAKLNFPKLY